MRIIREPGRYVLEWDGGMWVDLHQLLANHLRANVDDIAEYILDERPEEDPERIVEALRETITERFGPEPD